MPKSHLYPLTNSKADVFNRPAWAKVGGGVPRGSGLLPLRCRCSWHRCPGRAPGSRRAAVPSAGARAAPAAPEPPGVGSRSGSREGPPPTSGPRAPRCSSRHQQRAAEDKRWALRPSHRRPPSWPARGTTGGAWGGSVGQTLPPQCRAGDGLQEQATVAAVKDRAPGGGGGQRGSGARTEAGKADSCVWAAAKGVAGVAGA